MTLTIPDLLFLCGLGAVVFAGWSTSWQAGVASLGLGLMLAAAVARWIQLTRNKRRRR